MAMHFISKLLPKTLFIRFMFIIIIPILIGQIVAIFLFYDRHWYNVSYYTSTIIINEIESLIKEHKNNSRESTHLLENYLNLSYQFQFNKKLSIKQSKLSEPLTIFKNILATKIYEKNIVKLNKENKIEVFLELKDGILYITFPAKLLLNPTVYIFVLWIISLTIILLSVSIIFSKNQIKSILTLADSMDKFGRGILKSNNFKPSGALEIRNAGLAFLKMKARIEKQINKRTNMLAMISHDLRTPLTRMKLQLELMEENEAIKGFKQDILTMQQMINSYLDFAKGESTEEFEEILLLPWIEHLLNKWPHINIEFIKSTNLNKLAVLMKPNSFERALSNLIGNAIKYGTKIEISVKNNQSTVTIIIEDNGIGIDDMEKHLVFKPFYRSDKARQLDNSSNVGLGLAITKEIINNHKGCIYLEDSKNLGGLLVRIEIPKI
ncbi:osmolarity sensor protein EnvZ [Rickettsia typhi str. Wilmington]|uniref:histidine kinase n=3 Tax=Rickettsia typhi TaxID=785 RepID=Q68WV3_RICTY|nr:osmolarity sensor protein EnvZ [Rickettsia typhi str. Wilmington]AFE54271.1 osmolarity sensor protein EnvZ [Rickettsia typhi str. TH1527]AFE55111.1 osmolarity sensor protein EnvZ [Rickettsia typhi str. B9991CWPP]